MTEPVRVTEPVPLARPSPEVLAEWISAQRGSPTRVTGLDRMTVGNSRAMWRVSAQSEGAAERFVVRIEQGGVFSTSSSEEFRVMGALADTGFPVARVRWQEPTGDVLGHPFFVMDFVAGLAVAPGADERSMTDTAAGSVVAALAALHAITGIDDAFDIVPASPNDATHRQIDRWHAVSLGAGDPVPLLDEAAAWLHEHAPPLDRLAVVHGDAGPGNAVIGADDRVVALTDFEFTHLGDPREDWVYCAAMRGSRTMSRQRWAAIFERVAGVTLSDADWRYWEAFNLFKGACANRSCLALFGDGGNRAPNMLAIGTALHQSFLRRLVDLVDAVNTVNSVSTVNSLEQKSAP